MRYCSIILSSPLHIQIICALHVFDLCSLSGLEVIKLFPFSTQLSMRFILLINVKMPTIVGILTFISMINITSRVTRKGFIAQHLSYYEHLETSCSVELRMKIV